MSCLFCKIIAGEIPADIKFQDEQVIAFADINPQAPVHFLIVPKLHVENAAELAEKSPAATPERIAATPSFVSSLIRPLRHAELVSASIFPLKPGLYRRDGP